MKTYKQFLSEASLKARELVVGFATKEDTAKAIQLFSKPEFNRGLKNDILTLASKTKASDLEIRFDVLASWEKRAEQYLMKKLDSINVNAELDKSFTYFGKNTYQVN